jgi:N-acetylmuramoyl-L-alanine amidase
VTTAVVVPAAAANPPRNPPVQNRPVQNPPPSRPTPVADAPRPVASPPAATVAPATTAAVTAPPPPAATGNDVVRGPARLLAIHRTVLPDVVRLTLDIDREVPFRQDRLSPPDRIFYDLTSTVSGRSLADRTVQFDSDVDVVRQVRIGQHTAETVRVSFDATGVAGCSASPLYEPYRLVIDCIRSKPATVAGAAVSANAAPAAPPKPLTPATFARKPAPAVAAAKPPGAGSIPVPRTPATPARPPALLIARLTAPLMGVPALLYARSPLAPLAALLPSGVPPLSASQLTAIRLEIDAPPAVAAPPAMTLTTRQTVPVPTIASRTLDGNFSLARQLGLTVSRVVIDPGHGGHDPGAKGAGTTESALVLDIALRLEALLQQEPNVEVILTRRTDDFVPLEERTAIANRAGADLFLSIHANASAVVQAAGVETYYLNFATTENGAAVAARENAASGQPMYALPEFVKAIAMNGKLDESRDFATHVQRSLVQTLRPAHANLRDLGVKQAPFVVLIGASMPSVLAEVSFLTNVEEGKLLKGPGYRQRIADALFTAVQRYQTALTRGRNATGE